MTIDVGRELRERCRGEVRRDEMLSSHTSLRIGGPADFMLYPARVEDIVGALTLTRNEGVRVMTIGGGTNLLFAESGFRGLIINMRRSVSDVSFDESIAKAGAGGNLSRFAGKCADAGLAGLEFAWDIPGTVGGAVRGNAGAFDKSISDRLIEVVGIDMNSLESTVLKKEHIRFEYRSADFPIDIVITGATFKLDRGNTEQIRERMDEMLAYRKRSQPLSDRSAGCIFKNYGENSAGMLIDKAGCKGLRLGDACVSDVHGNFIINQRSASSDNVLKLIDIVREKVMDLCGVRLELEIRIVDEERMAP